MPQDLQNLAGAIDSTLVGVIVCTSTTRPASPTDGTEIYETDTKLKRRYDSLQGWIVWPAAALMSEDFTTLTTTSTGYAVGSTPCDITFVAPPSGKARLEVAAHVTNAGAGVTTAVSYEVRLTNAAGSVILAASQGNGVLNQGQNNIQASAPKLFSFFTPGTQYYVRTMHASGTAGQTGTIYMRRLIITPSPN